MIAPFGVLVVGVRVCIFTIKKYTSTKFYKLKRRLIEWNPRWEDQCISDGCQIAEEAIKSEAVQGLPDSNKY